MALTILYIGQSTGNSYNRAEALKRLGHDVTHVDPFFLPTPFDRLLGKWMYETGGMWIEGIVESYVNSIIGTQRFDIAIVNGGSVIGPTFVQHLRQRCGAVVNYNNDDPFGGRDRKNWHLYLKSVPYYDLLVVLRDVNVAEAYALGAKKVLRVCMSASEVAHAPRALSDVDRARWANEIVFVGTWMPERGPFLAQLVKAGLPLSIYGGRWEKAPEFTILKSVLKGNAIYGDDYAKSIQLAKISLGLLSKGNRDLHTIRSVEIPFLGGLFCAQRTAEHLQLYKEDEEAVFWNDADECIQKCRRLIADDEQRKRIAENGRRRCIENGMLDEKTMRKILREALA